MTTTRDLFSYPRFWAERLGPAPFLPMSRAEMDALGWEECDVVLVTGDAYVDHPSFGMALIGRLLEAQGFRVGVIAQPNWHGPEPFRALGRPRLFYGVTAGNMDSMVNRYTADRRLRSDDAYTPGGEAGRRPDRAVIVYAQRCRQAFPDVPIVLGGIEASLRRVAHYDYWSDKVRRSIVPDAKADLLLYGNAERALVALTHRLAAGEPVGSITDLRGTALVRPAGAPADPDAVRLPAYEEVARDPVRYAQASRLVHLESNPGNARPLVQRHGDRDVWVNPPPLPLSTREMDRVYELPYARRPHPAYGDARIPAYEMIRFSVTILRGCFGGCTFCSITEHEGRIIQSRSEDSVLREVETLRDEAPGFTGVVSDLGGPTANMYRLACRDRRIEAQCRRLSCLYPVICRNLRTDHGALVGLYRKVRALPGVKKVLIASGVRYDLALESPEYVRELVTHHVGGYLKVAPEHVRPGPLAHMMKPPVAAFERFQALFERYSREAGKEQYLVPYFIAAHPGTTDEDMLELSLWMKRNGLRADQVQAFLPSPMALATAMYHSGKNPLHRVDAGSAEVHVPRGGRVRRLHKAFLRYHDAENWPLLREALRRMGRADLIGNGRHQLVPSWQPPGTGQRPEGTRGPGGAGPARPAPGRRRR
ncbi:MAG: YgiQ family radical SAM protein [Gammaproteobacteria bacterium]|nr:YgiQ family radical SAM protein [Gammaproteobacteria bacterium]